MKSEIDVDALAKAIVDQLEKRVPAFVDGVLGPRLARLARWRRRRP